MARLVLLLSLVVLPAALATLVNTKKCDNSNDDICTVSDVSIDPCTNPKLCRLKKGKKAEISFNFTPHFSAAKLNTTAQSLGQQWGDLDPDACLITKCPTEPGQSQDYKYSLYLGKKLPTGTYTFTWQVFDAADVNNMCCFQTTVRLQ